MYRHHYGTTPVGEVSGDIGDLDVAAAWTDDKKYITLAIVNPDSTPQQATVNFGQNSVNPKASLWVIRQSGS